MPDIRLFTYLAILMPVILMSFSVEAGVVQNLDVDLDGNGVPDQIELLLPENWNDPGKYWTVRVTMDSGETTMVQEFAGEPIMSETQLSPQAANETLMSWLEAEGLVAILPLPDGKHLALFTEWGYGSTPPRVLVVAASEGNARVVFEDHVVLREMMTKNGFFTGFVVSPCFQPRDTFYGYVSTDIYRWNVDGAEFEFDATDSRRRTVEEMGVYAGKDCGGEYLSVGVRAGKRVAIPFTEAIAALKNGEMQPVDVKVGW